MNKDVSTITSFILCELYWVALFLQSCEVFSLKKKALHPSLNSALPWCHTQSFLACFIGQTYGTTYVECTECCSSSQTPCQRLSSGFAIRQSPRGRGAKSPPSVNLSICSPLNIPFHDKLLYQKVLIVQRVFHGENLFISWLVRQHNSIKTWETTHCGPLLPSRTWQIYWQIPFFVPDCILQAAGNVGDQKYDSR